MRLHENWELFSDALQAASQPVEDGGLGIKSIFIEKDYWICRSLSLMNLPFLLKSIDITLQKHRYYTAKA